MMITLKGLPGFNFIAAVSRSTNFEDGGFVSLINRWTSLSRQRRDLAQLSDHQLKDIGITRDDVKRELAKPFWQV